MKLTLTIELGNEAMQTGNDVACALNSISQRISDLYDDSTIEDHLCADSLSHPIRDYNGNRVGKWELTK